MVKLSFCEKEECNRNISIYQTLFALFAKNSSKYFTCIKLLKNWNQ